MPKLLLSNKKVIISSLVVVGLASLWLIPGPDRQGAELVISPRSLLNQAGQTWTADIFINSNQPVNSVDATIHYDPSLVEVKAINKDRSDFELTIFEPVHQSEAGTVQFVQTSLQGHQKTNIRLGAITFRGLKQGHMQLTADPVKVVAHDGQGSNVFRVSLSQSLASWLASQVWKN